jgi:hypothetical protein
MNKLGELDVQGSINNTSVGALAANILMSLIKLSKGHHAKTPRKCRRVE